MIKKLVHMLALSTALVSVASAVTHEDMLRDAKNAGQRYVTASQNSNQLDQDRWWNDYQNQRNATGVGVVQYVFQLSTRDDTDAKNAALWFLLKGGKYGFATREAQSDEIGMLKAVIHAVATHVHRLNATVETLGFDKDHQHVKILFQQVERLEAEVRELGNTVGNLTTRVGDLEREKVNLTTQVRDLTTQVRDCNERVERLNQEILTETQNRTTAISAAVSVANEIAERNRAAAVAAATQEREERIAAQAAAQAAQRNALAAQAEQITLLRDLYNTERDARLEQERLVAQQFEAILINLTQQNQLFVQTTQDHDLRMNGVFDQVNRLVAAVLSAQESVQNMTQQAAVRDADAQERIREATDRRLAAEAQRTEAEAQRTEAIDRLTREREERAAADRRAAEERDLRFAANAQYPIN